MKINAFPSRTWNSLKINDTELDFSLEGFPQVDGDADVPFDYECISTGLGSEFDQSLDSVYTEETRPQYFEISSDSDLTQNKIEIDCSENILSDIVLHAKEGTDADFILVYKNSSENSKCVSRIRLLLEENSHVHLITVNLLGKYGVLINSIGSECGDNSKIEITELELGGAKTYSGTFNNLSGYKSEFTGRLAYICKEDAFLDINQVAHQTGRSSVSRFTADGVLMDRAVKTWRGTIDFKRGCVDAVGDEQEDVLLLNPEVVNRSLPVILCDEEAVEGRHGCSIGKLDMDKLFYMQSRGVDYATAKRLLTKAKVSKLLSFIEDEELVVQIEDFVENLI